MEESGVVCGDIGGNKDWKIVVVSDSRCFGTADISPSAGVGERKLFMTNNGGERYSLPPLLGCFMALSTSLQREYFSTRKCNVGPRGVMANRRFVLPVAEREKRRRCETPRGPAIVV